MDVFILAKQGYGINKMVVIAEDENDAREVAAAVHPSGGSEDYRSEKLATCQKVDLSARGLVTYSVAKG